MQIIVLGMHRSGTSVVSRILNLMGCYFGSEDVVMAPGPDNPKGFWERLDVKTLNDDILYFAGGSWWNTHGLDFAGIGQKDAAFIRESMSGILSRLDAHRPWFIKDPRLCLTLDFWAGMLEVPVFVVVTRPAAQVARSLEKRNSIPLEYGAALWEYYNLCLLESLGTRDRITVSYNALLQDPFREVRSLHQGLVRSGVPGLRLPEKKEIQAFVDPRLCHFEDKDTNLRLSPEQSHLQDILEKGRHYFPDPEKIRHVADQIKALQYSGAWVEKLNDLPSPENPAKRLNRLQADNSRLQVENSRLKAENSRLQVENSRLQTENSHLRDRDRQFEERLLAVSRSRLVRLAGGLSRFTARGRSGLYPELERIRELLPAEPAEAGGEKNQDSPVDRKIEENSLPAPARIRHYLGLITLDRSKNALRTLVVNRGNPASLVRRFKDMRTRVNSASRPVLGLRELRLIEHCGLPVSSEDSPPQPLEDGQARALAAKLKDLVRKNLSETRDPVVSIIIPVHNQVRFTLACLHSLFDGLAGPPREVILADDNSGDQTFELLGQGFPGIRYLQSTENRGFLENCNQAARQARGRYLVFLNNDVIVFRDWLHELARTFEDNPGAGLVGSKLIFPEGRLQEAGGIVFEDGSAWNYGRFRDPGNPEFNYLRPADYCSGASIAVRADVWRELGGFDPDFRPAYYEDTDLCMRVRNLGFQVLYQPLSAAVHFEGISSGRDQNAGVKKHQAVNQKKFYRKWAARLKDYGPRNPQDLPALRGIRGRVLVVDANTPTPDRDSGSMDTFNYMRILRKLGFHVSFIPADGLYLEEYTAGLQRIGVRCFHVPWIKSVREGIKALSREFQVVILTRVGVASSFLELIRKHAPEARVLFDTVDLHFLREQREARLVGSALLSRMAEQTREKELEVIRKADLTFFRSEHEIGLVREILPGSDLVRLPIVRDIPGPSDIPFDQRRDAVFIGGFDHPPNIDAVDYLVSQVWPLVLEQGFSGRLIIAGSSMPARIRELREEGIVIRGYVEDLSSLFHSCLLSVAPLRYGAGTKGKVVTSLSYGVPCVATSVAAEGCGFVPGRHLLVEDDPESLAGAIIRLSTEPDLWAALSRQGHEFCRKNFSLETAETIIDQTMTKLLSGKSS